MDSVCGLYSIILDIPAHCTFNGELHYFIYFLCLCLSSVYIMLLDFLHSVFYFQCVYMCVDVYAFNWLMSSIWL